MRETALRSPSTARPTRRGSARTRSPRFATRWPNCSRFKASVGLDDETGPNGSVSFQVYADTSQVYDSGVMTATTATKSVDVSIAGASELRLVVGNGGDNINYDHGDWADARIECGSSGGGDTTPPIVNLTSPANGSSGVSAAVSPTATFSEPMDPATLTTSTFTLVKQGQTTPVAATVSYAGVTATLDPSADLEASTSYTATVKGGPAGAKDVAGNPLASDVSWSFTTASSNQAPTSRHRHSFFRVELEGGRPDFVHRARDRPAAGQPSRVGTLLGPAVAALSIELPHAYAPELDGHRQRLVQRARSRVPVLPRAAADCDRRGRSLDDHFRATRSDDGQPHVPLHSDRSPARGDATASTTPFTRTVIVGSSNSVSATSPQTFNGTTYTFSSWSDGGPQTHNIVAPAPAASYTATYTSPTPPVNTVLPSISGTARVGRTLTTSNGAWSGSLPMTFAYQWLRCTTNGINTCTTISGATAKTYVVTSADVNFRLRARVTATNAAGSATATSGATGFVKN